jgi:hypothetical protein
MLEQARHSLVAATTLMDEAAQAAGGAVRGTADAAIARIPAMFAEAGRELDDPQRVVTDVESALRAYLVSIVGVGWDSSVSGASSQAGWTSARLRPLEQERPSPSPMGVRNRHGDRFPEEALPYCDDLPPRVLVGQGNSPTTGIVEMGGRSYGEVRPSRGDMWSQEVVKRIDALGMSRRAKRYDNHVEMKAAAMLVMSNALEGRVIINHAPCGSEPGAYEGCDTFLAAFIPEGSVLTVLGTDAQGESFKRVYRGRAAY